MPWNDRYARQDKPWDTGRPSSELRRLINELAIAPCRVLEIGCGTGTTAVDLARQGYDVTAVDVAPLAIEAARGRARQEGVRVAFALADLLAPLAEQAFWDNRPFPLVFDRGVYHALRRVDLDSLLRTIRDVTAKGGFYIVLAGNANESFEGEGPPRVRADELCGELASGFELVQLREFRFDASEAGGRRVRPLAWSAVLRRTAAP